MIKYVVDFKIHIQQKLEDYEQLVADELDQELADEEQDAAMGTHHDADAVE